MNVVEQMKNIDICTVSKDSLVDISSVKINNSLTGTERKKDFLEQILNPYCYLCNNVIVKVSYADNGIDLAQSIGNYVKAKLQ